MTPDERWLASVWPFVRGRLPDPPARVLEIGCGPAGGFVPMLHASGYGATGVDPEAPPGPWYVRAEVERYGIPEPAGAIVACASLHHVADLGEVLDLVAAALIPGGVLVVTEWAWERFDEATARWCSARLARPEGQPEDQHDWLGERLAQWRSSGQTWDAYGRSWAEAEGLHAGQDILRELHARFDCESLAYGPYYFPSLAGTSEADEQAAIDAGQIQPNRIQYHGRRREDTQPG